MLVLSRASVTSKAMQPGGDHILCSHEAMEVTALTSTASCARRMHGTAVVSPMGIEIRHVDIPPFH